MKLPPRIAKLPKDDKGRPVPWFVHWNENGVPDFRVIGKNKLALAYLEDRCWVCGERLGKHLAFLIGPMCAVNRTSAEPPSHRDCAEFSAQACPFLSTPRMHRNEKNLPEHDAPGGVMIARNPGVILVWITTQYRPVSDGQGKYVFKIGPPGEVLFFREGRQATRAEILESINTGMPILREIAELDGPEALKSLSKQYDEAIKLVPQE